MSKGYRAGDNNFFFLVLRSGKRRQLTQGIERRGELIDWIVSNYPDLDDQDLKVNKKGLLEDEPLPFPRALDWFPHLCHFMEGVARLQYLCFSAGRVDKAGGWNDCPFPARPRRGLTMILQPGWTLAPVFTSRLIPGTR